MAVKESVVKIISDHWLFVGLAYLLTFGVWTAATGNDFISNTWRPVKETRYRGLVHLFATSFPMLYMVAYIVMQALSGDFKEMWTGLIALLFANLHVVRTIWGLWQLHALKQWLIRSIMCMESLGYRVRCMHERCVEDCSNKNGKPEEGTCALSKLSRRERSERVADHVLVNETLIDNRLSEGDVRCYLGFLEDEKRGCLKPAGNIAKEALLRILFLLSNALSLPHLVWVVVRSHAEEYSDTNSTMHLVPREPEEVWLRWASVFVAQVFPEWLDDMKEASLDVDIDSNAEYDAHRKQFALEMLISAALHTQHNCDMYNACTQSEQYSDVSAHASSQNGGTSCSWHNFLHFKHWDIERYPKLCNGTFSKQEFLRNACKRGAGFPYGFLHENASLRRKGMDEREEIYGYSKFRAKLTRAREGLPADLGERITNFGIKELEWLAVFLSVPDWSSAERVTGKGSGKRKFDASTSDGGDGLVTNEGSEMDSAETTAREYFAISNLRNQLGFGNDTEYLLDKQNLKSFPLLRNFTSKTLWDNRNLVEVSVHIDNMLALCRGGHLMHMLDHACELREAQPWKSEQSECSVDSADPAQCVEGTIGCTWNAHINVAKESFLYQFSADKVDYRFLEQSATYLGCSMEGLRSSLARWAVKNKDTDKNVWTPVVHARSNANCTDEAQHFKIVVSNSLASCIEKLHSKECFEQRFVQMRLLWELQNHFHNALPGSGVCPNQHEAMILCVLSFPSMNVEVDVSKGAERPSVPEVFERTGCCAVAVNTCSEAEYFAEKCSLVVRAVCAPQDVYVKVTFGREENGDWYAMTSLATENKEDILFLWETWRDAFCGRLEGLRAWQEEHEMPFVPVTRSAGSIGGELRKADALRTGTGNFLWIWTGWMPHRVEASFFEIETEKFILRRKKTSGFVEDADLASLSFDIGVPITETEPVNYSEAGASELQHASLVAHEVLRKISEKRWSSPVHIEITGEEILRRAKELLNGGVGRCRVGLLLAEVIGTELADIGVVESAFQFLIHVKPSEPAIGRARDLIERFCWAASSLKMVEDYKMGRSRLYFKNEGVLRHFKNLIEKFLKKTGYHIVAAESFARIWSSLIKEHTRQWKINACNTYTTAFIRSMASTRIMGQKSVFLGSVLPCDTNDRALLCIMVLFGKRLIDINASTLDDYAHKILRGDQTVQNPKLCVHVLLLAKERFNHLPALNTLGFIFSLGAHGVQPDPVRAVTLFESAVEKGNVPAMNNLAYLLQNGADGVEVDAVRAVKLYESSVEAGNEYAMNNLADLLELGADGVEVDAVRAVKLYESAVEKGNVRAMNNLGHLLQNGADGVEVDAVRAVKLYESAVEAGKVLAMNNLGHLLQTGADGVEVDAVRAVKLYESAVEKGDVMAMYNLGHLLQSGADGVEVDAVRAVKLYESAVEAGDEYAMCNLGHLLQHGADGVEADVARAVKLYESVVEGGNVAAMNKLALVLQRGGDGGESVASSVVQLYSKAVNTTAESCVFFNLAVLFQFGADGVERDEARAAEMYTQALTTNCATSTSANNLGVLVERGAPGMERSAARAVQLYRDAIERDNHPAALYNLAVLVRQGGDQLEADHTESVRLYELAVKAGAPVCAENLQGSLDVSAVAELTEDKRQDAYRYLGAIEMDRDVRAMHNLGVLLQVGAPGVPADPARAARLYARAAWEGAHVGAMEKLSRMLQEGTRGVAADVQEAEQLLRRSREFEEAG